MLYSKLKILNLIYETIIKFFDNKIRVRIEKIIKYLIIINRIIINLNLKR